MLGFSLAKEVFESAITPEEKSDLIFHCESTEKYLVTLKKKGIQSIEFRSLRYGALLFKYLTKIRV